MTIEVLQFGATGQLGRALRARASAPLRITPLDRAAADLSDPAACAARVRAARPRVVIIAAAYTQVDQAESEPDLAMRANAETPGAIAKAASEIDAAVIHISTDYVFDGSGGAPYAETAAAAPLNVYGRSKLAGEQAVLAAQPASCVLRASWVFDAEGKNFLTTMLRLGATRDALRIVADQLGAPTPADALADAALATARALAAAPEDASLRGVFHFQGAPHAGWADFAETIFAAAEPIWRRRPRIERIATAEYPTPAPRPLDTRLDCAKIAARFGVAQPDWRSAAQARVATILREQGA